MQTKRSVSPKRSKSVPKKSVASKNLKRLDAALVEKVKEMSLSQMLKLKDILRKEIKAKKPDFEGSDEEYQLVESA